MHRPRWKPLKPYIFFDGDIKILMHFSQPMKSFALHLGWRTDVGQRTKNNNKRLNLLAFCSVPVCTAVGSGPFERLPRSSTDSAHCDPEERKQWANTRSGLPRAQDHHPKQWVHGNTMCIQSSCDKFWWIQFILIINKCNLIFCPFMLAV